MLKDKVVLITGSSRGIGAATARLAKQYGATVVLHGQTESEQLIKLTQELESTFIVCDVVDTVAVDGAVKVAVAKLGRIDALINCAGYSVRTPFLETTDKEWLHMFQINVLGTAHFCQAVLPYMQKHQSGRIVNVASIRGISSLAGKATYSASKAAIINLTSVLAKEFAPIISVNAVAPGFTETELLKSLMDEELRKQVSTALLGRIGQPNEIAEALLFLASDRASFITGQTLIVDGGYSISGK